MICLIYSLCLFYQQVGLLLQLQLPSSTCGFCYAMCSSTCSWPTTSDCKYRLEHSEAYTAPISSGGGAALILKLEQWELSVFWHFRIERYPSIGSHDIPIHPSSQSHWGSSKDPQWQGDRRFSSAAAISPCIGLSWWRRSWAERQSSWFTGQSTVLTYPILPMVMNFGSWPKE